MFDLVVFRSVAEEFDELSSFQVLEIEGFAFTRDRVSLCSMFERYYEAEDFSDF